MPALASGCLQLGLGETQMLDKIMYEEEVRQLVATYEQQFHYAAFYAYMRLRWVPGAGGQRRHMLPTGSRWRRRWHASPSRTPRHSLGRCDGGFANKLTLQALIVCFLGLPCREQEIRNILWIAECVAQDQKNRVQDGIVFTY